MPLYDLPRRLPGSKAAKRTRSASTAIAGIFCPSGKSPRSTCADIDVVECNKGSSSCERTRRMRACRSNMPTSKTKNSIRELTSIAHAARFKRIVFSLSPTRKRGNGSAVPLRTLLETCCPPSVVEKWISRSPMSNSEPGERRGMMKSCEGRRCRRCAQINDVQYLLAGERQKRGTNEKR